MTTKFTETKLKSYRDLYDALHIALGEEEAKFLIGPIIDASVEIAMKRMGKDG